jgi:hypothetical protein
MRALVIEPLENLSLSLTPVTGLELFSYVVSSPIPLPTTVAGVLGNMLEIRLSSDDPLKGLEELVSKLREKLVCSQPMLLGPFIFFLYREKIVGPTITIHEKDQAIFVSPDLFQETFLNLDKCKTFESCFIYKPKAMIGVALERNGLEGDKKVKEGFMYKYPISTYSSLIDEASVKPFFTYLLNCERDIPRTIVRIGGEGRIGYIYTDNKIITDHFKKIFNPLNLNEKGIYIALSPIPLLSKRSEDLYLENLLGLEFIGDINNVLGMPSKDPEKISRKIIVERIGLGYYEVRNIRRPQILMMPSGTLIRVKELKKPVYPSILRNLYDIGFASLYQLSSSA